MLLDINAEETIGEVCNNFAKAFPALKLEFFSRQHHNDKIAPKNDQLPHNFKIKDIATNPSSGACNISEEDKVHDIQKRLEEHFGLHARFFRKTGDSWIEITKTARLSLKAQEEYSRETRKTEKENIETFEEEVE